MWRHALYCPEVSEKPKIPESLSVKGFSWALCLLQVQAVPLHCGVLVVQTAVTALELVTWQEA